MPSARKSILLILVSACCALLLCTCTPIDEIDFPEVEMDSAEEAADGRLEVRLEAEVGGIFESRANALTQDDYGFLLSEEPNPKFGNSVLISADSAFFDIDEWNFSAVLTEGLDYATPKYFVSAYFHLEDEGFRDTILISDQLTFDFRSNFVLSLGFVQGRSDTAVADASIVVSDDLDLDELVTSYGHIFSTSQGATLDDLDGNETIATVYTDVLELQEELQFRSTVRVGHNTLRFTKAYVEFQDGHVEYTNETELKLEGGFNPAGRYGGAPFLTMQHGVGTSSGNTAQTAYVGNGREFYIVSEATEGALSWEWISSPNEFTSELGSNEELIGAYGFVIDDTFYVGGGRFGVFGNFNPYLCSYSENDEDWNCMNVLEMGIERRQDGIAFVIGSTAYFGFGNERAQNPRTSLISFTPPDSFNEIPLPAGIQDQWGSVASVVNDDAYITSGQNLSGGIPELWKFCPSCPENSRWERLDDFLGDAFFGGVAMSDGRRMIVGLGIDAASNGTRFPRSFWQYDPDGGWQSIEPDFPLPEGRADGVAFALNQRFYIGCGQTLLDITRGDILRYTPPAP